VPPYATLDARLAWRTSQSVEVAVVGQNLLQAQHVEFGHNPPPIVAIRRAVSLSVTLRR
jgi:hypothetical protein